MKRLTILVGIIIFLALPYRCFCQSDSIPPPKPVSLSLNYGVNLPFGSFRNTLHARAGTGYSANLHWYCGKRIGAVFSLEHIHYGIDDVGYARELFPDFNIPDQVSRIHFDPMTRPGWNYTSFIGGPFLTWPHNKSQTRIDFLLGMSFLAIHDNINFKYTLNDTLNQVLGVPIHTHEESLSLEMRVSESYALGKHLEALIMLSLPTMIGSPDYGSTLSENTGVPAEATFHYRMIGYHIPFTGIGIQAGLSYRL